MSKSYVKARNQSKMFVLGGMHEEELENALSTSLISHKERNKVIRQEIWQTYIRHKWIHPLEPLPSKMSYYKEHFMKFSKLGFNERPKYLDVFLPNALRVAIG